MFQESTFSFCFQLEFAFYHSTTVCWKLPLACKLKPGLALHGITLLGKTVRRVISILFILTEEFARQSRRENCTKPTFVSGDDILVRIVDSG